MLYEQLGPFSNLVDAVQRRNPIFPAAAPGPATQRQVREVLGCDESNETPHDVRIEQRWERDGLVGEAVSWSVGYGPRTQAWLLKPAGAAQPLPGVVALHDHGGFKFYGKEKIADGPDGPAPGLAHFRVGAYGGRAFANELARAGFAVLIHDTFLWGSRRFPFEVMPPSMRDAAAALLERWPPDGDVPATIALYNEASDAHEDLIAKYCTLLGLSLSGIVSHEDRIAVNYLRSRPDIAGEQVGCVGLSGGGCRAALLQASHPGIGAAVIVAMMSSYADLLSRLVFRHTWMLFPPGWSRHGDWPDLAACRAPSPLLVQYALDDELFTPEGMRAADARIAAHYAAVGAAQAYSGQFFTGPHQFDRAMQDAAFTWLQKRLRPAP